MVVAGQVVAHPTFVLTLNFDRRLMAGAQAARFFKRIIDLLEQAGTAMLPFLAVGETEPLGTAAGELASVTPSPSRS